MIWYSQKILIVLLMLKDDPHPITTDNLTVYPCILFDKHQVRQWTFFLLRFD